MKTLEPQSNSAKYLRLAKELRAQLSEGRLKPGDQLPSFVELRQKHNVSRGTVEKVHALLERDGLIVREQGRGVFVADARSRPAHGVIAFTGGGFTEATVSLFWANLTAGIQDAAIKNKVQVLLINHIDDTVWDRIDGLLISENEEDALPLISSLPNGTPVVSLLTPIENVSCALAGDANGAYLATRHLLSLGHRRIGHLVAGYHHLVENRLIGYRRALREYGIEPHLAWVKQLRPRPISQNSVYEFVTQGRQTIASWLKSDWHDIGCTAVLAQNDPAAIGAIEAFQTAGIRVPEDVSVVGYDGIESYDYFSPKLTTVVVPVKEIGSLAVSLLLNQITHGTNTNRTVLPAQLRVGESTAQAPDYIAR